MRYLLHDIILEGNTNDLDQEIKLNGELILWRTTLESRVQRSIEFKGSISLKLFLIGPCVLGPWTPI